jgi:hypothetical protein
MWASQVSTGRTLNAKCGRERLYCAKLCWGCGEFGFAQDGHSSHAGRNFLKQLQSLLDERKACCVCRPAAQVLDVPRTTQNCEPHHYQLSSCIIKVVDKKRFKRPRPCQSFVATLVSE